MFLCQSLPRLTDKPHTKMQYIQVTVVLPQWSSLLEHPVLELYCTHYSSWLEGAQKSRYNLDLCRYIIYMCKLIWCSFMFKNNDKRERERALVLHILFFLRVLFDFFQHSSLVASLLVASLQAPIFSLPGQCYWAPHGNLAAKIFSLVLQWWHLCFE